LKHLIASFLAETESKAADTAVLSEEVKVF
jgi:hypothetical protein